MKTKAIKTTQAIPILVDTKDRKGTPIQGGANATTGGAPNIRAEKEQDLD